MCHTTKIPVRFLVTSTVEVIANSLAVMQICYLALCPSDLWTLAFENLWLLKKWLHIVCDKLLFVFTAAVQLISKMERWFGISVVATASLVFC